MEGIISLPEQENKVDPVLWITRDRPEDRVCREQLSRALGRRVESHSAWQGLLPKTSVALSEFSTVARWSIGLSLSTKPLLGRELEFAGPQSTDPALHLLRGVFLLHGNQSSVGELLSHPGARESDPWVTEYLRHWSLLYKTAQEADGS